MSQPPSPASSGPSTCVLQLTCTNGMPASTSRRAIRQHWPNRCGPYASRTRAGSRVDVERGQALAARRSACAPARNAASCRAGPAIDRAERRSRRGRGAGPSAPRAGRRVTPSGRVDVGQLQADARLVVEPERVERAAERAAPLADGPLQPLVERVAEDRRRAAASPASPPCSRPTIAPGARPQAPRCSAGRPARPPRRCSRSGRSSRRRRGRSTRGASPAGGRTGRRAGPGRAAARRPGCPGPPSRSARTARDTRPGRRASCRTCRGGWARPRARA